MLVVVVRYFGGIKLGIPGLIRAYKSSTADALSQAEVVEKIAGKSFRLRFGYLAMNPVMKVLKDMDIPAKDQEFGMDCALTVRVRLSLEAAFRERILQVDTCNLEEIS